jgi:very-short-patch-repair endonuclease
VAELLADRVLGHATQKGLVTVFAERPGEVMRALVSAAEEAATARNVVSIEWARPPRLDLEIARIVDAVAEAARSLWPEWCMTATERRRGTHRPRRLEEFITAFPEAKGTLSAFWLRHAWGACQAGDLPLVKGMSAAEQLRNLALALDPTGPLIVLGVGVPEAPLGRVLSLAKATEWLAREARAPTVLVVPRQWQLLSELDCVNYASFVWKPEVERITEMVEGDSETTQDGSEQPCVVVEPVIGAPHPLSEVEKAVHEWITGDEELAPLFQYNRFVAGAAGQPYKVDLLWSEGGLIVELDGTEHWHQMKYCQDRERDYQLTLAGYCVLRISNDEVAVRRVAVLDKIRNMVRYCREEKGRA